MKRFKEKLIDKLREITESYGLELIKGMDETFYIQPKDSFLTIATLDFNFYDNRGFLSLDIQVDCDIIDCEKWQFERIDINFTDNKAIQKMFDSVEELLGSKYQKS